VVKLRGFSPRCNRPRLIEVGSALPSSPGQQLSDETSDFPSSFARWLGAVGMTPLAEVERASVSALVSWMVRASPSRLRGECKRHPD